MFRGVVACVALLVLSLPALGQEAPKVAFEKQEGKLVVRVGGEPVGTYVFGNPKISRPHFIHLHAPGGIQVTRNHPPQKGDPDDHAEWHPGLWLAFSDLSGNDYWRLKAKVVHEGFAAEPTGGAGKGAFAVRNKYVAADGKKAVCRELCTVTVHALPSGYLIVWDSVLTPEGEGFTLGAEEEMGLGVRMAAALSVDGKQGARILDSAGRKNGKGVWGRQADWCDYSGPIGGKFAGVLVMPDPANGRKTWWHARDYGLLGANPSGAKSGEPARFMVGQGKTLRLRYGVLLHTSAREADFDPAAAYKEFLPLIRK
jgi:hypothetical protein